MRAAQLLLAVIGFSLPSGAASADENRIDRDLLARLQTEGKAAHDKYLAVGKSIEAEYEWRSFKTAGGGASRAFTPTTRQYRFCRTADNYLLEEVRTFEGKGSKPRISLRGWNRDYLFTLSKANAEAPYVVADYQLRLPKNQGSELISLPSQAYGGLSACLDVCGGSEKSTTLKTLVLDRERSDLLWIRTVTPVEKGVITNDYWLEPGRGWRGVESRVETPTLVATTRLEYGRELGGVEFPVKSLHSTKYKGTTSEFPPNFDIESTLTRIGRCDKTDADFRLIAFGLPEPVDAPPPSRAPRYVWFLAAAVGFAVLAVVFRWLTRRRNPPPAPEGAA